MTATGFIRRHSRPPHRDAATHVYAVGQAVRLKSHFGSFPKTAEIYHVTGRLPARGGSPQYRVRSEEERHERMVTQDSLEPVREASGSDNENLVERTFGHGQGTKTQQSRTPETETGKGGAKN